MVEAYEPVATTDTRPYWEAAQRGRLRIQRCSACRQHYFYPRPFCPHCSSPEVEWVDVSGTGKLESYVINARPLPGTEGISPVIALIRLTEGPVLLSNVVDVDPTPENLPLDLPVEVTFQTRGSTAVPVFRPRRAG